MLDKNYRDQVEQLYRLAFGGWCCSKFQSLWSKGDAFWRNSYGRIEDGSLVSLHNVVNVQVLIRQRRVSAHYLSHVATMPSHRNCGYAKQLFIDDLQLCQSKGIPLVLFDPFKHFYYRKWGCEIAMDAFRLKLAWSLLSQNIGHHGHVVTMGYLKDDLKLQESYRIVDNWFWDNPVYNEIRLPSCYEESWFFGQDKLAAVVHDEDGQPCGYLRYTEQDKILRIDEMRYTTLDAFYALKGFLLSYEDQVNTLVFENVAPDFPISLLVDDFWQKGACVEFLSNPFRMMRFVDVCIAFQQLLADAPRTRSCFRIFGDKLLPENNGCYVVSVSGKVYRDDNAPEDVIISISDLVPLVTGRKSAAELYWQGKLKIPGKFEIFQAPNQLPPIISIVDGLFPKTTTFSTKEL